MTNRDLTKRKAQRIFSAFIVHGILLILAALYLAPLGIMFLTSLKSLPEIRDGSLFAWPQNPGFAAWSDAWSSVCIGIECRGIRVGFWNSVRILVPSVALSLFFGALTAYAITFWRVRFKGLFMAGLMLGAFIPYQVYVYPLIKGLAFFNLYGTLAGIILIHIVFGLPLTVLLYSNFFKAIPPELIRAARIDGAGFLRLFVEIILPMSLPVSAIAGIMQVTGIWNDYMLGLTFAGRENLPMTVQLANVISTTNGDRPYNIHMAATILTALVPLAVYFLSDRLFVRAIAAGAVKG